MQSCRRPVFGVPQFEPFADRVQRPVVWLAGARVDVPGDGTIGGAQVGRDLDAELKLSEQSHLDADASLDGQHDEKVLPGRKKLEAWVLMLELSGQDADGIVDE